MSEGLLDEMSIDTYETPVQLDLEAFDTVDELKLTIVETTAKSIVNHVDVFDDGDRSYITTQVEFDHDGVESAYYDGETEHLVVETTTRLGVLDEEIEEVDI